MASPAIRLFARFGTDIVSVVPPGTPISPSSNLRPEQLGKAPSRLNAAGEAVGYPWLEVQLTEADAAVMDAAGLNVGLKAARWPSLDIDTEDAELADVIRTLAFRHLGLAPVRGRPNSNKVLLPYELRELRKLASPLSKMRLSLPGEDAVELLARGQQFLIHGTHPSGAQYTWDVDLTDAPLSKVTGDQVRTFLTDTLPRELAAAGYNVGTATGSAAAEGSADQSALLAPGDDPAEQVAEIVALIPNDARFADRAEYVKMAHAVKAAGGTVDAFLEWSARWQDGDNDPEYARGTFEALHPPFRVGFSWLVEQAGDPGRQAAVKGAFRVNPEAVEQPGIVAMRLQEMNERHAVVLVGSNVVYLYEMPGAPEGEDIVFLGAPDFERLYENQFLPSLNNGNRPRLLSKEWRQWPERREYPRGSAFLPGDVTPEGVYNFWKGWAHEPSPDGSCDTFLHHLREHVCNGDEEHFQWLLDWMAHMVQRPLEKPGTAVILIGEQGVGKTKVGEVVRDTIGSRYALTVSQPDQVTGRFNSHLDGKLLLMAEEAFFAADRSVRGVLKQLVTGDTLTIERKGVDAVQRPNSLRIIATSNERFVWPVEQSERRAVVFRVGDAKRNDREYFGAMTRELEAGGYAKLMHLLLNREIDDARLFGRPPVTDALQEQAGETLAPEESWLLDLLETGEIPAVGEETGGRVLVPVSELYDDYRQHVRAAGGRFPKNAQAFGHFIRDELDATTPLRSADCRIQIGAQRSRVKSLPPLAELRARHSAKGRGAHQDWPDDITEWQPTMRPGFTVPS